MLKNSKDYSSEQILHLADFINGNESSFLWLTDHCKELAAVADVITKNDDEALDWLKSFSFDKLYMFAIAFLEDFQTSIDYFLKYQDLEWAAVLDACRDNETALIWLREKDPAYGQLAVAILNFDQEQRVRRRNYQR